MNVPNAPSRKDLEAFALHLQKHHDPHMYDHLLAVVAVDEDGNPIPVNKYQENREID